MVIWFGGCIEAMMRCKELMRDLNLKTLSRTLARIMAKMLQPDGLLIVFGEIYGGARG